MKKIDGSLAMAVSTPFLRTAPGTTQHVRPQRCAFHVFCDANSALFLRGAIDLWRVLVQIWYEHESTLGKFPVALTVEACKIIQIRPNSKDV